MIKEQSPSRRAIRPSPRSVSKTQTRGLIKWHPAWPCEVDVPIMTWPKHSLDIWLLACQVSNQLKACTAWYLPFYETKVRSLCWWVAMTLSTKETQVTHGEPWRPFPSASWHVWRAGWANKDCLAPSQGHEANKKAGKRPHLGLCWLRQCGSKILVWGIRDWPTML